jgi:hypothetical protein
MEQMAALYAQSTRPFANEVMGQYARY